MADEERLSLWKELAGRSGWKRLRLVLRFWTAGFAMMALLGWAGVALSVATGETTNDIWLFVLMAIGVTAAGAVCWRIAFR